MERSSAFKPKKPALENPSGRVESAREAPLKSLEEDTAKVAVFNNVFNLLSEEQFTTESQLDALVNPQFRPDPIFNESVLINADQQFVKKANGGYIFKDKIGSGFSQEQCSFFQHVLSEKVSTRERQKESEEEVRSLKKGFELIQANAFESSNVLINLVNPKFSPDPNFKQPALINANQQFVKKARGGFIFQDEIGKMLTREGLVLLQDLFDQQNTPRIEKTNAESETEAFEKTVQFLLKTNLNESFDVSLLINPKFSPDPNFKQPALINANQQFVKKARGGFIFQDEIGTQFSQEQAALISEAGALLTDPTIPSEVRESLKAALATGGEAVGTRLDAVMEMSADPAVRARITTLIYGVRTNRRSTNIRKEIYGDIVADKNPVEISAKLAGYEELDLADRELVRKLQEAIAGKRRFNTVAATLEPLGEDRRDIDAALSEANKLLSSTLEADRRAGLLLTEQAYRVEIATYRKKSKDLLTKDVDPEEFRLFTESLPIRPTIGEIDYVQAVVQTRDEGFATIAGIEENRRLAETVRIRANFARDSIDQVLEDIEKFPGETEEDIAIKQELFTLYRSYVATNRPEDFDTNFAKDIEARKEGALRAQFISPELGRNREAFNYVRSNFVRTIFPLVESLRADTTTSKTIREFLETDTPGRPNPKRRYEQRLAQLESQRLLTDVERTYLESVELLSLFNPYLVASVYADQGVTSAFLKHHFERLSESTLDTLKDGDYVPLIQIGTGPNGAAAIGELVRNNPMLAQQTLIVDAGKQPGGPFAVPEGAAWELNSANRRGAGGANLPDAPDDSEITTVRSYGSPLRWYPGERANGRTVRQGSINVTVDYLPTPDDLSTARYSTNEEEQTILALQWALLAEQLALNTRVIKIDENPDKHGKGDKLVTLEITESDGSKRELTLATDAVFGATGLGEPGFGFKLEGSRAEKVIEESKDKGGFPKISRTLEAFGAFAGRTAERASPGETLVIYGKGNSADTLIEYVGNIFQGDNPKVRDVTKVYVIADGDLSARPRYALINDLKPRNGRGNLIEQVQARVADIDFYSDGQDVPIEDRKLVFIDSNGQALLNNEGNLILADSAIAATGFRSQLDDILEKYSEQKNAGTSDTALRTPLVLPTNSDIAIAQTLTADPSVLILGTASAAEFDKVDKLAQLPREAREALLRNGVENAVAIGFRTPDTQAAVNIWVNTQDIMLEPKAEKSRRSIEISEGELIKSGTTRWIPTRVNVNNLNIPNNIENEIRFLSPLIAYSIGNEVELRDPQKRSGNFSGELLFELTSNPEQQLGLTFSGGTVQELPRDFISVVEDMCADPDFEKYAYVALQKKRRNQKLNIILTFKDGKIDPRNTFVQS